MSTSSKLRYFETTTKRLTDLLTGLKCRATSVAKKWSLGGKKNTQSFGRVSYLLEQACVNDSTNIMSDFQNCVSSVFV